MKLRILAASTALAVAGASGGAIFTAVDSSPAAAAAPAPSPAPSLATQVPCTVAGVASTCTLTVTGFSVVDGAVQAAGTVTGGGVTVPFSGVPVDPPGSCPILSLTLGPLHLNLLGLVVDLNQVQLNITAQQGPGNLLGNLLCAVANLLNNNATGGALTNLVNDINAILAGL